MEKSDMSLECHNWKLSSEIHIKPTGLMVELI